MHNIHPAAWLGLLFNLAVGWLVFSGVNTLDVSALPATDQETARNFIQAVSAVRPFFFGLLLIQVVSLALIASGRGYGLIPAAAAAFFMMPGSLFYLIGCALSHCRVKYAAFRPAPSASALGRALFVRRSSYLPVSRALTVTFFLAAAASHMLLRSPDFTLIFAGLAAAGVYCTLRAGKNPALRLFDEYFVFSPAFFAHPLLARYVEVEEARLKDRDTIIFLLHTDAGTRELRWSLHNLDKQSRKDAVTELGAALEAHQVPLR
jgi:hypothetical protein